MSHDRKSMKVGREKAEPPRESEVRRVQRELPHRESASHEAGEKKGKSQLAPGRAEGGAEGGPALRWADTLVAPHLGGPTVGLRNRI